MQGESVREEGEGRRGRKKGKEEGEGRRGRKKGKEEGEGRRGRKKGKKGGSAFIPTLKGGDFPLRPLHPRKLNPAVDKSHATAEGWEQPSRVRHGSPTVTLV